MKFTIIMAVVAMMGITASAQVRGQASTTGSGLQKSEVQVGTSTNAVRRARRGPAPTYGGVVVQASKMRNPLQLINPFAPASYGSGEANTSRDVISGRGDGLKIWAIQF